MRSEVLIVGAGPTGLVLALWLTKMGVDVRILDKTEGPGSASRALAVQARTLELYRQLGLSDEVRSRGVKVRTFNIWVNGRRKASVHFEDVGIHVTPYPGIEVLPQDTHEILLTQRLESLGVVVERRTELIGFTDDGDMILARVKTPGGGEAEIEADFIVGCDGARSSVRGQIGAEFPGGTYPHRFYVADVEASGASLSGGVNVALDGADFMLIFPLKGEGRLRLVGAVRGGGEDPDEGVSFGDVSMAGLESLGLKIEKVNWFSSYSAHHRVADRFRKGRAFLAGDAGHIHSPVGGQGMNTGIQDAINLAWKLKAVLRGEAGEGLLSSYEAERIAFARRLVRTTDRIFTFVTAEGRLAEIVRPHLVALFAPLVTRMGVITEFLFRTVSQTGITYRTGPLAEGRAGAVHGGDRLPWVAADLSDNFASLDQVGWRVHVYGRASEPLIRWSRRHRVPLDVFDWTPRHGRAGLARDAAYLVRPDAYVAVADPAGGPAAFDRFSADHALSFGP